MPPDFGYCLSQPLRPQSPVRHRRGPAARIPTAGSEGDPVNSARQQQHDDPGGTDGFLDRADAFLDRAEQKLIEIDRLICKLGGNPEAVRVTRELIVSNLGISRLATAVENLSAAAVCAEALTRRNGSQLARLPHATDERHLRLVAR